MPPAAGQPAGSSASSARVAGRAPAEAVRLVTSRRTGAEVGRASSFRAGLPLCGERPSWAARLDKAIAGCRADDVEEIRALGRTLAAW